MTSLATWKIDLWTAGRLFRGNSTASHCGTLCGPICLHRTTEHQQQTLKALQILKLPTFGPQTQNIVTPHVFAQARMAEVAREHGWPPPKSLDSDENFKPEHTLFCRELRFKHFFLEVIFSEVGFFCEF